MTYKPGTVAKATVRGVPNVLVMSVETSSTSFRKVQWQSATRVLDTITWADEDVTDIRPLVVVDLDATYSLASDVVSLLRRIEVSLSVSSGDVGFLRWLANQIEKQAVPPRIPEPGLWGVVKTRDGDFVNVGCGWLSVERGGMVHQWATLRDPVLVRPGIEDDAQ